MLISRKYTARKSVRADCGPRMERAALCAGVRFGVGMAGVGMAGAGMAVGGGGNIAVFVVEAAATAIVL